MDDLTGRDGSTEILTRCSGVAALSVALVLLSIGLVSAIRSLAVGFGASPTAALALGVASAGLAVPWLLVGVIVALEAPLDRTVVTGAAASVAGVTLFWLTVPAGWQGELTIGGGLAAIVYVGGVVALAASLLADQFCGRRPKRVAAGVRTKYDPRANSGSDAIRPTDGGTESDEIREPFGGS